MIVDREVSLAIIRKEIAECDTESNGWTFSEIDEANQSFRVHMKAKDDQLYIIEIKFDDYKHTPLYIEFVDPANGALGVPTAYPKDKRGFFNQSRTAICHPCNRKAYAGFTGLHSEWNLSGWQTNPGVGSLKSLKYILQAIYAHLTNDDYAGRMAHR
jgi:hypothetical protein